MDKVKINTNNDKEIINLEDYETNESNIID